MTNAEYRLPTARERGSGQNIYRQVSLGYAPFIGAFAADHIDNLQMKTTTTPRREGYWAWGPSFGYGEPFAATKGGTKPFDRRYAIGTQLPWAHWLYKGNAMTWAMQLIGLRSGLRQPIGSFGAIPSGGGVYNAGPREVKKGMPKNPNLVFGGLRKPSHFSGAYKLKGSEGAQQALLELMERGIASNYSSEWVQEVINETNEGKLATVSPPTNLFGDEVNWSKPPGKWKLDAKMQKEYNEKLAKMLVSDALKEVDLNRGSKESIFEGGYKPYAGDSSEESGIGLLMDMVNENVGITSDKKVSSEWDNLQSDKAKQYRKGSKVGALGEGIKKSATNKNRQTVDLSTQALESDFVYLLKDIEAKKGSNSPLNDILKMDPSKSVGIEVTALDIADKGGYKMTGLGEAGSQTLDTIISEIDTFNDSQVKEIESKIKDEQGDLNRAVRKLEMEGKSEEKISNFQDALTFQSRQTATRLLDAIDTGKEGFEFIVPARTSDQGNVLASWSFHIYSSVDGYVIEKSGISITKMQDNQRFFIDLIGSTIMGSDAQWVEWRDKNFNDILNRELVGSKTTDDLLGTWVQGTFSAGITTQVYPTTAVGYKTTKEIADDLAAIFKAKFEGSNMKKTTDAIRTDTSILTERWKSKSQTNNWESTRKIMENERGFASQSLIPETNNNVNQWAVPFLSVERAGAAGSRGFKGKSGLNV